MGGRVTKIIEKMCRVPGIAIKPILALTEHVFLSSEGLYALSACHFRATRCFEHASV